MAKSKSTEAVPGSKIFRPAKNPTPVIGGACAIAAGGLAVIQGLLFLTGTTFIFEFSGVADWIMILLGILEILLGLASLNAGFNAINEKRYGTALLGSVLGTVAVGLLIGALLGLVAVMLIAQSREEFSS